MAEEDRDAEGTNPAGRHGAPTEELIPIVQRAYDFAVDLYGAVNRFPRAQKPLLGRELVGLALRLLVTLVTANRRRDKVPALDEASGTVDALRITLRLSTRLSLLSLPDAPTKRPRAPVRYRMTSPSVERYLRAKLEHPQDIVFRPSLTTRSSAGSGWAWRCATWRPPTSPSGSPRAGFR